MRVESITLLTSRKELSQVAVLNEPEMEANGAANRKTEDPSGSQQEGPHELHQSQQERLFKNHIEVSLTDEL